MILIHIQRKSGPKILFIRKFYVFYQIHMQLYWTTLNINLIRKGAFGCESNGRKMKKKLKRLISILLSTAWVFILLCNIFTAESKIIDISLSNIQITGDQQAVKMLNIDEGSYMGNGMFHITFNTAELRLISVDAVSYTHLDVYKRQ